MTSSLKCTVARTMASASLVVVALSFSLAMAYGRGEKIEFSTPDSSTNQSVNSPGMSQDINRLNPTPNALKQMQDELFHPMTPGQGPVGSLQGVFSLPKPNRPQQSSAASSAKSRRATDKRKNWAFNNMAVLDGKEDSADSQSGDPSLAGDDKDKNPTSLIEEFVFGKGDVATNQNQRVQWSDASRSDLMGRGFSGSDSSMGPSSRSGSSSSGLLDKGLFADSQGGSGSLGGNSMRDHFGGPSAMMDSSALQKHREDFKTILNSSFGQSDNSSSFRSSSSGNLGGGSSFGSSFSAPSQTSFSSGFNTGGSLHGSTFDKPFSSSLGGASAITPMQNSLPAPTRSTFVDPYQDGYSSVVKHPKL